MARYKDVHYDQDKSIPVFFRKQILPGTCEFTLSYLIDNELDLMKQKTIPERGDTNTAEEWGSSNLCLGTCAVHWD